MGLRIDIQFLFCLLFCLVFRGVSADFNVTVDDGDTAQIIYSPPDSWEVVGPNSLDFGESHTVTTDPTATATFTFTGVAIYFLAPLFPFDISIALSLDGEGATSVSLQDISQPVQQDGPETTQSTVVWHRTGLENTEHTLVISVAHGKSLGIMDGLLYTVPETSSISSAPSTTTTPAVTLSIISTRPLSTPSASANASTETSHQSKTGLSIALGIVCTVFGLLVLYAVLWYWRRRQRQRAEEDSITHNELPPPEMSDVARSGNLYGYVRPRSSRYRFAAAEARQQKTRTSARRPGPSGLRHSTTAPSSPVTSQTLTTIPETTREDGSPRPLDRFADERGDVDSPPWTEVGSTATSTTRITRRTSADANSEEREPWTYPRPHDFSSS